MELASASQMTPPSRPTPADPFVELERLRALNRRWRRVALGIGAGFAFLFILSLVQFLGTLTACKLLKETQRESARMNRETADYLRDIRNTQQRLRLEARTPATKDVAADSAKAAIDLAKTDAEYQEALKWFKYQAEMKDDTADPETQAKFAALKARLRALEEQQKKEREGMEQERIQRECQALKKLRDEGLPAGHEPDKSCPHPKKSLDGPSNQDQ